MGAQIRGWPVQIESATTGDPARRRRSPPGVSRGSACSRFPGERSVLRCRQPSKSALRQCSSCRYRVVTQEIPRSPQPSLKVLRLPLGQHPAGARCTARFDLDRPGNASGRAPSQDHTGVAGCCQTIRRVARATSSCGHLRAHRRRRAPGDRPATRLPIERCFRTVVGYGPMILPHESWSYSSQIANSVVAASAEPTAKNDAVSVNAECVALATWNRRRIDIH